VTAVRPAGEPAAPTTIGHHAGRAAVGLLLVLAGAVLAPGLHVGDLDRAAWCFVLVWVGCLVVLSARHRDGFLAPAGLYLLVFGLFHGGLLVTVAIRGDAGLVVPIAGAWIYGPTIPAVTQLCVFGMGAFTGGVLLARRGAEDRFDEDAEQRSGRIGTVGLGLTGIGFLAFLAAVATGGGLSGSYDAFFAASQGSALLTYGVLLLGLGVVFATVGTPTQRRLGLTAFVLFGLLGLPLGMRGPVLFLAVVVLAIEVRRGRRIHPGVVLLVGLAVLVVVGVVRETRAEGPGAILKGDWASAPSDAVSEMGYSLYPSVIVHQWHAAGEPYRHGVTLVAVPLRYVERLTGKTPSVTDDRLFNVEIMQRVGGVGGSPVAEGYHNFGTVGVIGLMGAIGLAIGLLDRRPRSAASSALLAIVLLPLVIDIRNSFAPVLPQIVLGLVFLGAALLMPRESRAERVRRSLVR
jgi:hypothetical protein